MALAGIEPNAWLTHASRREYRGTGWLRVCVDQPIALDATKGGVPMSDSTAVRRSVSERATPKSSNRVTGSGTDSPHGPAGVGIETMRRSDP